MCKRVGSKVHKGRGRAYNARATPCRGPECPRPQSGRTGRSYHPPAPRRPLLRSGGRACVLLALRGERDLVTMPSRAHAGVGTSVRLAPCLASCLAMPQALRAQDVASSAAKRPPTFASAVDVVNLCVSVTDPRDAYVKDLAPGDFRVLEDGVPQDVVLFSHDRVPLSVAFLIDNSLSMQQSLPSVKAAARGWCARSAPVTRR